MKGLISSKFFVYFLDFRIFRLKQGLINAPRKTIHIVNPAEDLEAGHIDRRLVVTPNLDELGLVVEPDVSHILGLRGDRVEPTPFLPMTSRSCSHQRCPRSYSSREEEGCRSWASSC